MAELDLLSAEGFVEDVCGPLILRTAAVQPPSHPLGAEYAEPCWGIFASAKNVDLGWIELFATPTPDRALETLDADALERTERLSILIGASWAAVAKSTRAVAEAQETAVMALPPEVYELPLGQLRGFRASINAIDPNIVAALLQMTFHWQTDPGGTHGPRFAA